MKRRRWREPADAFLEAHALVRARFSEIDMMRVVWHGHYLGFFEEARIAWGAEYAFDYQTILDAGYVAPIVHAELDYFQPARFGDELTVRIRMHPEPGAWITFTYLVQRADGEKLASGHTVQAFTDLEGGLVLTRPLFFEEFLARTEDKLQCARST